MAPPIHLYTCQADWLNSRSARSIPSQRQTGMLCAYARLCISYHQYYINRQAQ